MIIIDPLFGGIFNSSIFLKMYLLLFRLIFRGLTEGISAKKTGVPTKSETPVQNGRKIIVFLSS